MSNRGKPLSSTSRATRRRFLQLAGLGSAALVFPLRPSYMLSQHGDTSSALNRDPRRPIFHLLPVHNWMNDPNGPIYIHGRYHMFFQYNPEGPIWGNMSWNHAISPDMLHWSLQPVALRMTPGGPDAAGCFSGSTLAVPNGKNARVYAFYTGVVRDPEHETIPHQELKESQCMAWTDDPELRAWMKWPTPVIPNPPAHLHVSGFRDPSVWEQNGAYYMTVGSGIKNVGGCVLLYRSDNLLDWQYVHPLARGSWNENPTPDPVDDGEMWECPEVFALGGAHVLIYSTLRKTFWQSGALPHPSLCFQANTTGELDLGAFYAPKTQLDGQARRILWGWIPEQRSEANMIEAGWSGMLSLPRWLSLDPEGSLRMQWLPEMTSLRRQPQPVHNVGRSNSVVLLRANGEALCTGSSARNFEVVIDLPDKPIRIQYAAATHSFEIGNSSVPLHPGDSPRVHLFLDGSVVEILLGERITVTERFYYSGSTAPDVIIKSSAPQTRLQAWEIAATSAHPAMLADGASSPQQTTHDF